MSVVVVGSANLDLVFRMERIPGPGETVLATGFESNPGGKGNNQVVAAARAGADATFIAAVGADSAADQIVSTLESAGVRLALRRVVDATGTAIILVDDGAENSIVVNPGANGRLLGLTPGDRDTIRHAGLLLLQLETPIETVIEAAEAGRDGGATVVLNAAPIRTLPPELLGLVDLLIVNEHEAERLARDRHGAALAPHAVGSASAAGGFDEEELAEILTGLDLAVIITLGARGALVCVPGEPPAHVAGISVEAVDTTGAGDTFCGALVAALDERPHARVPELDALLSAADFATRAAAISVGREGAVPSIPTRDEIMAFEFGR